MSNLYIRLMTGFWSHRKTARLRALLGDDALWIVPRLWSYAAENQPDGNLSGYTSEELAMLLGCSKHAPSMLQALRAAGFVDDDGMIHNWQQHNGYHESYSKRAKSAAEARWAREREKKEKNQKKEELMKEESGKRKVETSIALSMLVASASPRDVLETPTATTTPTETEKPQGDGKAAKGEPESEWSLIHAVELPVVLRTPECLAAAKEWLAHKKEIRSNYRPTGIKNAVAMWAKDFTSETFPAAVQRSIASGWKGIHGQDNATYTPRNGQPRLFGTSTPDDSGF